MRSVPAAEFFKSIFETALEPGELLTEIQVPKPAKPAAWSFQKFNKRAIDFAIVGVAVQGTSVALVNMGSTPLRAAAVESALASGASAADAAAHAADGTNAGSDIHASKAYREHLARVLVRRALEEAAAGRNSRAASGAGCPRPPSSRPRFPVPRLPPRGSPPLPGRPASAGNSAPALGGEWDRAVAWQARQAAPLPDAVAVVPRERGSGHSAVPRTVAVVPGVVRARARHDAVHPRRYHPGGGRPGLVVRCRLT